LRGLAVCLSAVLALNLGAWAQVLAAWWHPQWGSTLPTPLAQMAAFLIASPFFVTAVRRPPTRQEGPPPRTGLAVFRIALGLVIGGAFLAGLRNDVIPPEDLAGGRLIEDIHIRGFRLDDEGWEGTFFYKDFVGGGARVDAGPVEGLPPDFEPVEPGEVSSFVGVYGKPVAAWSGPHPWDDGQTCRIDVARVKPYRDDPPGLRRATVYADCD
jgi:hypothetical protein